MSKIIKEQHENMHTNSLTSPSKYKGFHFNPSQQQTEDYITGRFG
jgi:ABC-type phosphate transport system ATPase subunit